MMFVFGMTFSQEVKSETPKETVKIEKTDKITKKSKVGRVRLRLKTASPFEMLFYIPKKYRIKTC